MYSPVVDSAFEVSLALHRTTTWRWRLAERHVRLTVRRLKQGDDDNDVAAVHQPLAVVAALQGSKMLAPLLVPPHRQRLVHCC